LQSKESEQFGLGFVNFHSKQCPVYAGRSQIQVQHPQWSWAKPQGLSMASNRLLKYLSRRAQRSLGRAAALNFLRIAELFASKSALPHARSALLPFHGRSFQQPAHRYSLNFHSYFYSYKPNKHAGQPAKNHHETCSDP
jgi:hypothetical protein